MQMDICAEQIESGNQGWLSLHQLAEALEKGHSDDKTDDDCEGYYILHQPWHNPAITPLLEYIDSSKRTTSYFDTHRPGARPRKHI
jgi:hypothetical protein